MSTAVVRTAEGWWVETPDGAHPVRTAATTTAALLTDRAAIDAATGSPAVALPGAALAPVTRPCRVVAQMTNYRSHAREAGLDPDHIPPIWFRKASHSIVGPTDDVVRPAHVRFLDHEVEIALVIGRDLAVGTRLERLADGVAGLVVANDVSARDVQLPKTQFYESKSYPTFTPLGPRLVLLDDAELGRFDQLRLRLSVNGEIRQDALAADMITGPLASLNSLLQFQDLAPGDVVLTGTPGGTALVSPPKLVATIGALLPPQKRWPLFFRRQAANPRYLRDGDVMTVRVATDDGAIDLGTQVSTVRSR